MNDSPTIRRRRATNAVLRSRTTATAKANHVRTIIETWEGPWSDLVAKQNAVASTAETTRLTTTDGGSGSLEITYESALTPDPEPTIEIEWVELRRKLEDHPRYATLQPSDIRAARARADDESAPQPEGLAGELADKLARGQTDYCIAVPVVRRTTARPVSLSSQGAWFRQTPPVTVPGTWQWLKTADRITRSGRSWTRVEEWTAAQVWDPDIYL